MPLDTLEIERRVIRKLLKAALAKGHQISVNDGGEWVLIKSQNQTAIMAAMFSTDEDRWRVRSGDGDLLGEILFIHGNGRDVISDYSYNEAMRSLIEPLNDYIDSLPA